MPCSIACRRRSLSKSTHRLSRTSARARAALVDAYFRLGRAYGFDRDLEPAEACFRRMQRLAERWIADEPADLFARDQLATSHRKIADCRKLAGDDLAARAEYEKAIGLGQALISADPANVDVKLHLALALDDQAVTLRRLGLFEEAGPLLREAEQHFTDLLRTDPEDIDNRMRLHQTQYHVGCLEMDQLKVDAARVHLRQACDGITTLDREGMLEGRPREKDQLLPSFLSELAACDAVAATPANLKTLRLAARAGSYRLLRIHFGLLATAGRFDDLPAAAEALCVMEARGPENLYQLGRSLAWCAGRLDQLAATAATPDSEAVRKLRQRLADRAVAVLLRAASDGLALPARLDVDGFLAPHSQGSPLSAAHRIASNERVGVTYVAYERAVRNRYRREPAYGRSATMSQLRPRDAGPGPPRPVPRLPARWCSGQSGRVPIAPGHVEDDGLQLTLMASSLYRLLAGRIGQGYEHTKSRHLFRDFVDATAKVKITESEIVVRYQKRAHNPLLVAAGFDRTETVISWLGGKRLQLVFG